MTHREKEARRASTHKSETPGDARRPSRRRSSRRKSSRTIPKAQAPNPDNGLPPFWEVRKTKAGRMYFINHQTKKTQWDDPRPLPAGWRSGKTGAGKTYYINDKLSDCNRPLSHFVYPCTKV